MSTPEGENKSTFRSRSIKEDSKAFSLKNSSIYNPELLSKRNVIINTSTSKEMFSFSTAKRFQPRARDESQFFYNLPTYMSHRGTSFGYGTKMSFSTKGLSPGPGAYNYIKLNLKGRYPKSDIPNSPQSKFGSTIRFRNEKVISDSPAPNSYNLESMIKGDGVIYNSRYTSNLGKSMGLKLGKVGQSIMTPGPGSYDYMKMNLKGKYPSSILSNSIINSFGNEKRFRKGKENDNPAPNAYRLESMIKGNGIIYNSKHSNSLGKSMGMRYNTVAKSVTPGPGAYEFFSDFEGFYNYGKNQKFNESKIREKTKEDKKSTTESQKEKDSKIKEDKNSIDESSKEKEEKKEAIAE